MNPTYTTQNLDKFHISDINKTYLEKIDFYSYISKEDKKRRYEDDVSVRTSNLDRLLYFCNMVKSFRDGDWRRNIFGDIDYEWDCILEDTKIFRYEANPYDFMEADLVYIKGNISGIKKLDYLKKYLNKRIRWFILWSMERLPVEYDNIYMNCIDTIIQFAIYECCDNRNISYENIWEQYSNDPYYHNCFVRNGSRGSMAWITNWIITIIGSHNIKTKRAIRLVERFGSNYLHSLYNPHTDRGYKFALKNIDWAFEKKRKFNVKKKVVVEEDEIYIGEGVYL